MPRKILGDTAAAISKRAEKVTQKTYSAPFYATWLGAETVDSSLSRIKIRGGGDIDEETEIRFVPKGKHVTGLTANCTVLCIPADPVVIALILEGDITQASL